MASSITTTTVSFTEARSNLSELVNQVAREEANVVIEKHGVPVGVIVSPREFRLLERLAERERLQIEAMRRMSAAFEDVSEEELEREVNRALAEVREEMRAERGTVVKTVG
jgi:prevent-host-death family protein